MRMRSAMTPTDSRYDRAAELLDQLAELVDETHLTRHIDEPIERAAREFKCADGTGMSHHEFLDAVADFLRHLYANAFPHGRQLTPSQARDEAVALLEQAYQGTNSSGYDGALLDAIDPSLPGLGNVLARVADLVWGRQCQMHVHCIVGHHLDPGDWELKCATAAILLDRCRPYLPAELQDDPPERFADDVSYLLAVDLVTRD